MTAGGAPGTSAAELARPVPAGQVGPLAQHPTYATVDPQHKWRRISDWASGDSAGMIGGTAGSTSGRSGGDSSGRETDDVRSVDSSLLELELARARASVQQSPAPPPPSAPQHPSHPVLPRPTATFVPPFQQNSAPFGPHDTYAAGSRLIGGQYSGATAGSSGIPMLPPYLPSPAAFPVAGWRDMGPPHGHSSGTIGFPPGGTTGLDPRHAAALLDDVLDQQGAYLPGGTGGRTEGVTTGGTERLKAARAVIGASQAALVAEKAALEGRAAAAEGRVQAAEDRANAAQRRHSADVDALQQRCSAVEAALEDERRLCSQVQSQLAGELQRVASLTATEASMRASEAALREALEQTRVSLAAERRRADDAIQLASDSVSGERARLLEVEQERAGLEKHLMEERDAKIKLQTAAKEAARTERSLRSRLSDLERQRQDQDARLVEAGEQVSAMRKELGLLHERLTVRDQQLLKHVEDMEKQQIAALRREIDAARHAAAQRSAACGDLLDGLASVHQTLHPAALAEALRTSRGSSSGGAGGGPANAGTTWDDGASRSGDGRTAGYSHEAEEYRRLGERIAVAAAAAALPVQYMLEGRDDSDGAAAAPFAQLSKEEVGLLAGRVRDVLQRCRSVLIDAERRDAAFKAEMDEVVEGLRTRVTESESQSSACGAALRTATGRVEELMGQLATARSRLGQLEGQHGEVARLRDAREAADRRTAQVNAQLQEALSSAEAAVAQHNEAMLGMGEQLAAAHRRAQECRAEAVQWQDRARDQEAAALAARARFEELQQAAEEWGALAQAKDDRIRELRAAATTALTGRAADEDLMRQERDSDERRLADAERLKEQAESGRRKAEASLAKEQQHTAELEALVEEMDARLSAAQRAGDTAAARYSDITKQVEAAGRLALQQIEHYTQHCCDAPDHSRHYSSAVPPVPHVPLAPRIVVPTTLAMLQGAWDVTAAGPGVDDLAEHAKSLQLMLADLSWDALSPTTPSNALPVGCVQALVTTLQHSRLQDADVIRRATAAAAETSALLREALAHIESGSRSNAHGWVSRRDGAGGTAEVMVSNQHYSSAHPETPTRVQATSGSSSSGAAAVTDRWRDTGAAAADTHMWAGSTRHPPGNLDDALLQLPQLARAVCAGAKSMSDHLSHAMQDLSRHAAAVKAAKDGVARAAAVEDELSRRHVLADRALQAEKAAVQHMAAELETLHGRCAALQQELSDARTACGDSKAVNASLVEEVRAAQGRLQEQQAACDAAEAQLAAAREEVAQLRRTLAPHLKHTAAAHSRLKFAIARKDAVHKQFVSERAGRVRLQATVKERDEQIRTGVQRLRKLSSDADHARAATEQARAQVAELEAKVARADALLPRMEERRISLESDRRTATEKVARLNSQVAELTKQVEAARKAEAAARHDTERALRAQLLQPEQQRSRQMLEHLEGAEVALRESQSTSTRLLAEAEALQARQHASESELADLRAQLATADASRQALQLQLQAAEASRQAVVSQLHELQQQQHEHTTSNATPGSKRDGPNRDDGRGQRDEQRLVLLESDRRDDAIEPRFFDGGSERSSVGSFAPAARGAAVGGPEDAVSEVLSVKDRRITELRHALVAVMAERDALLTQASSTSTDTNQLQAVLDDRNALHERCSMLTEELASANGVLDALQEEVNILRQQLEASVSRTDFESQRESWQAALQAVRDADEKQRAGQPTAHGANPPTGTVPEDARHQLESELRGAHARVARLEEELAAQTSRRDDAEAEAADLRAERQRQQAAADALRSEADVLQLQCRELQAQLHRLVAGTANTSVKRLQMEMLQKRREEEGRTQSRALQARRHSSMSGQDDSAAASPSDDDASSTTTSATTATRRSHPLSIAPSSITAIGAFSAEHWERRVSDLTAQAEDLQARLTQAVAKAEAAVAQAEAAGQEAEAARAEAAAAVAARSAAEAVITDTRRRTSDAEREGASLRVELLGAQVQLDEARHRAKVLEEAAASAQASATAMRDAADAATARGAAVASEVASRQAVLERDHERDMAVAHAELEAARDEAVQQAARGAELQQQLHVSSRQLEEVTARCTAMHVELQAAGQRASAAEAETRCLVSLVAQYDDKAASTSRMLRELEGRLESETSVSSQLNTEVLQLMRQRDASVAEAAQLREAVAGLRNATAAAERQAEAAQADCDGLRQQVSAHRRAAAAVSTSSSGDGQSEGGGGGSVATASEAASWAQRIGELEKALSKALLRASEAEAALAAELPVMRRRALAAEARLKQLLLSAPRPTKAMSAGGGV